MNTFTENEIKILDALVAAVKARGPDYVYGSPSRAECSYLEFDGSGAPAGPSCLIGHAVLGAELLTPDRLHAYEGMTSMGLDLEDVGFGVRIALRIAQELQDQGRAWGEALAACLTSLISSGYDVDRWLEPGSPE